MRIKELIESLRKLEKEFPDHELHIRNGSIVDRVEISNEGPEIVLKGQNPAFSGIPILMTKWPR